MPLSPLNFLKCFIYSGPSHIVYYNICRIILSWSEVINVVTSLQESLEQRAVLQPGAEPTGRRTGVKVQSALSLDHTHFIVSV